MTYNFFVLLQEKELRTAATIFATCVLHQLIQLLTEINYVGNKKVRRMPPRYADIFQNCGAS